MASPKDARLDELDLAALRAFGFMPWCRAWRNGQDITERMTLAERLAWCEAQSDHGYAVKASRASRR